MRPAFALTGLLLAGPAQAQLLAHRLDTLSVGGVRVLEAQLVQGELRARDARGWLRRR